MTLASCSLLNPRKGPPEAVRISFRTSLLEPERRHCAIAECSESTGTICPGLARLVTSSPPTIKDSLFASASVLPVFRAASVGASPIEPVIPFITTSASVSETKTVAAADPRTAFSSGSEKCLRCSSRASAFEPAARPTT